jgi:DNA-directed RNA polymerase specialized sigma24 family protein
MGIPVTSMTLLKVLGDDAQSPRWTEFANKYASTIDGFLFKYFPSVDAADVVNETLIALVQKLPVYVYDPDTKGHFRNFLIGIVRYKAIEQIKKRKQEADRREALET